MTKFVINGKEINSEQEPSGPLRGYQRSQI